MKNQTMVDVSTRAKEGVAPVKSHVTFDWSDMTDDDAQTLAQQALVVKLQGGWRRKGIPEGAITIKVADYRAGRAPRQTPDEVLAALMKTDEGREKIAAMLKALEG